VAKPIGRPQDRPQDPTQDWAADRLKFGLMDEILTNSKARRDFHILQTYEAGIVLHGTEVKSLRAGRGQITDAFARVERNEVWLHNAHIDEYSHGNLSNHLPKTARKLLLNRSEIRKLLELAKVKGNTLVPLSFYWKSGKIKVQLAVGKGKDSFDKRDDVRERESDREIKRAMMHRHKGR
jgi:SsrA-binding protein